MTRNERRASVMANQRGVAAIIVALSMVVLLGVAALAIDLGYRNIAQNELQNIADAAALAGAAELSRQYLDPAFLAVNDGAIIAIAREIADTNESEFVIPAGDIQIGRWVNRTTGFEAGSFEKPNAVRVIAKKDGATNSLVQTFFARIWSVTGLNVQADATAALTGSSKVGPGKLEIPVGISQEWFTGDFCDQNIQFYPTSGTTGCAGWHNYEDWPANAAKLRDVLDGLNPDITELDFTPPAVDLADDPSFVFIGGNLSTATDNIGNLFEAMKEFNATYDNGDGTYGRWEWETMVVVYGEDCGENPNQTIPIVGFATVLITGTSGPPPVLIASVECNQVEPGVGGGGYYGTWGTIPGLVE